MPHKAKLKLPKARSLADVEDELARIVDEAVTAGEDVPVSRLLVQLMRLRAAIIAETSKRK